MKNQHETKDLSSKRQIQHYRFLYAESEDSLSLLLKVRNSSISKTMEEGNIHLHQVLYKQTEENWVAFYINIEITKTMLCSDMYYLSAHKFTYILKQGAIERRIHKLQQQVAYCLW